MQTHVKRTHPSHIAHSFDNDGQGLTIVAHSPQQEDHFWDEVTVLADVVSLRTGLQQMAKYSIGEKRTSSKL